MTDHASSTAAAGPEPTAFVVGVDLGQARDFTAVVVNECSDRWGKPMQHRLTFLHRFPLGTSYPDVADGVRRLIAQLPRRRRRPELVVDATGVGRPVVEMIRAAGLAPIGVTITAGIDELEKARDDWRVPKRTLAARMQVVLQEGRLKIAAGMALTPVLTQELQNFRAKINIGTGAEGFEAWREADHDDLVLAAAVAVWRAESDGRRLAYDVSMGWVSGDPAFDARCAAEGAGFSETAPGSVPGRSRIGASLQGRSVRFISGQPG
jgi:hypothetical protein